jgi:hypothetical protein
MGGDHRETDLLAEAYKAAEFADSLVKLVRSQGRDTSELFIALTGLVAARDEALAIRCLVALDLALSA